jgi:microcystin-dependent protein
MGTYKNDNGSLNLLAGGTVYADSPIGTILPFGGSTQPLGWLFCRGQAVSRTTYADLFAVIGTSFGAGDGSTTFNLPNFQGKVPAGYNSGDSNFNVIGKTGGEATHKLTIAEMPSHAHDAKTSGGANMAILGDGNGNHNVPVSSATPSFAKVAYSYIQPIGGGSAHNNLQPYVTTNYIIRAEKISMPVDFATEVDNKISNNMIDSVTDGSMKAVTSNAVNDALFRGVSDYDGSHPVVNEKLTTDILKSVEVTTTEDNTVYYIYAGNGSNSTVSSVTLSIMMNNKTIYVNRIINTNYGVVAYTTPPIKKGVKITFQANVTFTGGTANLYVYKLT